MNEIDIEIDGKLLKVQSNSMVIQAADNAGIYIPRFCYHKHLSVAANCRMCLVEVEKAPKALPACATPVMPGMKVFTKSSKALAAQKAVMEFLLINHPLDCPICDQGGECELQDLSLGYGKDHSFYYEGKRSVKDEDIGALIATDMTRCIQCTRCVRFGNEVAGLSELGVLGRGETLEIGTYIGKTLHSNVSGNVIDLCPVGALTSKPYRFSARPWELIQYPSIAPHDCLGSNINIHIRRGKVMRVVPRENAQINETWISDRDRFSYEGLYHSDRLVEPLIRENGKLKKVSWEEALTFIAAELQTILKAEGGTKLGALATPFATVEELYLLQKLMRALGSSNLDHRLRQSDFSDDDAMPLFPGMHSSMEEIEQANTIFLIGYQQNEVPVLNLRLRKASLKGANIIAIKTQDYPYTFTVKEKIVAAPHHLITLLMAIAKQLNFKHDALKEIIVSEKVQSFANYLASGKKIIIILGTSLFHYENSKLIRQWVQKIIELTNGALNFLTEGPNTAGAWLSGFLPHREAFGKVCQTPGLCVKEMLTKPLSAYLLLNIDPELDTVFTEEMLCALEQAKLVVAFNTFHSQSLYQYAHVILPIAPFAENSGTFLNALQKMQNFQSVASDYGLVKPAWKVFKTLGNLLHLPEFPYETVSEVLEELETLHQNKQQMTYLLNNLEVEINNKANQFSRIGEIPIYRSDSLVRRAKSLQAIQSNLTGPLNVLRIHPDTAISFGLKEMDMVKVVQKNKRVQLPIKLDGAIPKDAFFIPGALLETAFLPHLFGSITIEK